MTTPDNRENYCAELEGLDDIDGPVDDAWREAVKKIVKGHGKVIITTKDGKTVTYDKSHNV